ncbi:MAG TPA: DUF1566 domain-containing protein [Flavobacteriales bacterium]|jgi:hypothetical protein|nr:DUF1566 domain-containing protein [Flavobacteriales bacterium]HIB85168.1 DUF1566 domain-containing protein [Chromatiaceae bacterium]
MGMGKIIVTVISLILSTSVNATLLSRLVGQAYYDTVLDITWLGDANYAMTSGYDDDGYMDWEDSLLWADQLVYAGFDNWRLPSKKKTSDPFVETCIGYNCDDTEMAFMFYVNLGGDGGATKLTGDQGPFVNIRPEYWADIVVDSEHSINYHFSDGIQFTHPNYNEFAVWAVMDGDIGAVPIPASVWLFCSGLLGLFGATRWKDRA